jgi:MOSC domain-containing protein YiiM
MFWLHSELVYWKISNNQKLFSIMSNDMGLILGIFTKNKTEGEHGLPKLKSDRIYVSETGLEGDFNNYRFNSKNNTPNRAVLLYTEDKLLELNDEGWPIKPGDIGENFLISNINYDSLSIGTKVRIGEIELEIAEVCDPCSNLSVLPYVGKDRIKEFIKTMKGRRGWYAKVIKEGSINQGNEVIKLD